MTSKPKRATVAEVMALVEEKHGNVASIARYLKVGRGVIYNRINGSAQLRDALKSARETMLDNVESSLYSQALNGNTTAMIFFLKTQGRDRGYQDKVDVEHSGDMVIQVRRNDSND